MRERVSFQISAMIDACEAIMPEEVFETTLAEARRQRSLGLPEQRRLLWLVTELHEVIYKERNKP